LPGDDLERKTATAATLEQDQRVRGNERGSDARGHRGRHRTAYCATGSLTVGTTQRGSNPRAILRRDQGFARRDRDEGRDYVRPTGKRTAAFRSETRRRPEGSEDRKRSWSGTHHEALGEAICEGRRMQAGKDAKVTRRATDGRRWIPAGMRR
jgi:hypothetical protein